MIEDSMPDSPRPADEQVRLAVLRGLGILDTPAEERFDRITRLATRLYEVPIALVSLVDENRQWFKSRQGLDVAETPRDVSFCAHTILGDELLVISDAQLDERFADNPLVTGAPHIRFYAGCPLRAPDGTKLGTLCVIDHHPRSFGADDRAALQDLAELAAREIALGQVSSSLVGQHQSAAALRALLQNVPDGIITFNESGEVEDVNEAAERLFREPAADMVGQPVVKLFQVADAPEWWQWLVADRRADGRGKGLPNGSESQGAISAEAVPGVAHPSIPREAEGCRRDGTSFPIELTLGEMYLPQKRLLIAVVRDVSERRRVDEQMREQLAFVNAITANLGEGIYALDRTGSVTFVNPAAEQMLGWSPAELLGQNMHDIVHCRRADGSFFPREECPLLRVLQSDSSYRNDDDVFLRKDGTIFPVAYTSSSITANGQVMGAVVVFHDRSERKRSHEALQESEERYRSLVETSPDAIVLTDLRSKILTANQRCAQMYGFERVEDLLGKDVIDMLAAEDHERAITSTRALLETGNTRNSEYTIIKQDGTPCPVEVNASVLRDRRGAPTGFIAVVRDISKRKEREQKLQEALLQLEQQYLQAENARSRHRAVLDATVEGMILLSPDGEIMTVNRRLSELFAIEATELVGQHFDELQPRLEQIFTDPTRLREMIASSVANPECSLTEMVAQKWPSERHLELVVTPVRNERNQHLGSLYLFRDATQERQAEQIRSEFVSLVSHELRTPLTSIKGYVDLLLEGEVGDLSDEQCHFLEIVKNNADRLIRLINDLLDVSSVESGKIELKLEPVDLARVIRSVQGSLRPQLEAKRQKIKLDLPSQLPSVFADTVRVGQILTNLLSNAHKYTPEGGEITVTAAEEDGVVRIDVQDTGIGLTPEEQQRIFDKFFRAKNRAMREVGGTGLGLSITEALVQLHGGVITVRSEPGRGSTFSFTLAVAHGNVHRATQASLIAPSARILVVDDEPDIGHLIQRYLERAEYQVVLAHTAEEGVRIARSERPDLITLDIMLPDVDGFTALEWLKQDAVTAEIPIMLLSILPDIGKGQLVGAVDYLTKPVHEQILLERIGQILTGKRGTLLVVDDDADLHGMLDEMLTRAGYRVIVAADGVEALEVVRRHPPDLALIDVKMPRVDGIAVLRQLRADGATRNLPVIVMTGELGMLEQNRRIVEALGSTILPKPLTPEELAAAIGKAFSERQRL